MRKQTMITNANAERSGDPPQTGGDGNSLPREMKESNDRQDVINHHHDGGEPIDFGSVFGCYHQPSFRGLRCAPRMRQGDVKTTPLLLHKIAITARKHCKISVSPERLQVPSCRNARNAKTDRKELLRFAGTGDMSTSLKPERLSFCK
jgi:hypothetical protein